MRNTICLGKISSAITFVIIIVYYLLQLLLVFKFIPGPANLYWFIAPSFLLSLAYLVTIVCIDVLMPENSRKWIIAAWTVATINCILLVMIFLAQPYLVNPSHFHYATDHQGLLYMSHPATLMFIKYVISFLISASTFLMAFAFKKRKDYWLFRVLFLNGFILPIAALSYFYQNYQFLLFAWIITFPAAIILIHRFFRKEQESRDKEIQATKQWIHYSIE